jgi:hypothetical protein
MLEGWEMVVSQWLSPLGITSIMLFILGSVLIIWNIFRRELTFEQKREIVADREIYLPQLNQAVDSLLSSKKELAKKAGLLSLEEYYNLYLSRNNQFEKAYKELELTHKEEVTRRKVAIITALNKLGFHSKNLYYYELQRKDKRHNDLKTEYDSLYAKTNDSRLNKRLDKLFDIADKHYSISVLVGMTLNAGLSFKAPRYQLSFYEKPRILENLLIYQHQQVNNRINELLKGVDLNG